MWNWDQGRMGYFQFGTIKTLAKSALSLDLKNADPDRIRLETGLLFAPASYTPWRNYSRIFKLCLLVRDVNGIGAPTDVARILAQPGVVTCDEYVHFLIEATSDPSPALSSWNQRGATPLRYPLCFSLKYILAKIAGLNEYITPINEVIGAYMRSGFVGTEDDTAFLGLMAQRSSYAQLASRVDPRQARESIKFISQISYLHCEGSKIIASISQDDAKEIFGDLSPIAGPNLANAEDEIDRLASFFRDGSDHDFFDYKGTVLSDVQESGFTEGSKVKKTHIVIERNSKLRKLFFLRSPHAVCDACRMDTARKYPWVDRVLDIHHILPLSSGTRVDAKTGTTLEDLVAICPTCHRAVHRFSEAHLRTSGRKDFNDESEARAVYSDAKAAISRGGCFAN